MFFFKLFFFFQRSFRKELFEDAGARLERSLIKSGSEVEQFKALATRAAEIAIQNIKKEVDYNDAPDEFRGKSSVLFLKFINRVLLKDNF